MSRTRRLDGLGLIGSLGVLQAAAQPALSPPRFDPAPFYDVDPAACARFDRPGEPVALVGLTQDVDPANAPIPGNDSERLLFRQVYDTLVHIGCDFTIQPGLAAAWQRDAAGTHWIIALRHDAIFSDGTSLTARDVIASWTRGGSALRPEVTRFVRAATVLDDGTLSVVLEQADQDPAGAAPVALAQPALAIARFAAESPWPLGTRDVRVEGPEAIAGRTTITLVPSVTARAAATPAGAPLAAGNGASTIRFLVVPDRDARDILDQGVDLLLTRDPATLAYADALAQFDSIPLPWLRSYVFLSREPAPVGTLTPELRRQLAEDAITGEGQGSSYDWAQVWGRCAAAAGSVERHNQPHGAVPTARLVYDRSDAVARALAERLAVLTTARSADANPIVGALLPHARVPKLQTVPLRGPELSSALVRGEEAGFIIALDRSAGCGAIAALEARVPWISGNAVVALVDTRLRAIVRRGRSRLAMEWDGSLLMGRSAPSR